MTTSTLTAASTAPEMIFTMGLPAAGKSTVVEARYAATHTVIDPDAVKEGHKDYDPKNPAALHQWSTEITESQFAGALAAASGRWVVDGTGTNAEKMVRKMNAARCAGFTIRLVYVTCTIQTSIARNAARTRVVPAYVIIEKARDIATSFELIAPHADSVEIVKND